MHNVFISNNDSLRVEFVVVGTFHCLSFLSVRLMCFSNMHYVFIVFVCIVFRCGSYYFTYNHSLRVEMIVLVRL